MKRHFGHLYYSQKRYVGNLYEFDIEKFKQKSMGIVLKRRDNAPIVKIIYGGIIDKIMNDYDLKASMKFFRDSLKDVLAGKFSIDKFVISKTLRGHYKNPDQIVHKVLADRMFKRDQGSAPQINDRVNYVFTHPYCSECKKDVNELKCRCLICNEIFYRRSLL